MISMKAYAKVNLFINVLNKREDGYHLLEMVNAKVDLYDQITVSENPTPGMVLIKSNDMFLSSQNNIVVDVAQDMMHRYVEGKGVTIEIDKKIPFGAGLAGNSTDAATIVKAINELFGIGLTKDEMIRFTLPYGADIPYCLSNDLAFVEGIGEKITPIDLSLKEKQILLVNPKIFTSTKEIFDAGDKHGFDNVSSSLIRKAIEEKNTEEFILNMHNALQKVSIEFHPEIKELYEIMNSHLSSKGLVMTGSGSTFIYITDKNDLRLKKFIDEYSKKYFINIYNFL
ncbi:MAG: 4-(cytidine 5'-diphospho)-2-C-methyl-D-erythritol kinase [Candidatus Izemoplasmatales bacterium]